MKVTAIFDIGKTNKKFLLFDDRYQQVHKAYERFDEIVDDDGDPADDLPAIEVWIKEVFSKALASKAYTIDAVNFSAYGASFVHIGADGRPLTPIYNYTKPMPPEIMAAFYAKYGSEMKIACETASSPSGMLNSGFQLYWLKYAKPEIFSQIRYSLHFPQYLSYLFTGIPVSDYTSIGCHTSLWDYRKNDYHDWVYAEEIDRILPPIVRTETNIHMKHKGQQMKIGVGIHDSSAALLPYLKSDARPFLLISTGTWSIALNPYSEEVLTAEDLQADCLNYMRIDGKPVKAARLFLGNEYKLQVQRLNDHFGKDDSYHRQVQFDENIYYRLRDNDRRHFRFDSIHGHGKNPDKSDIDAFSTFEEAYCQLMLELLEVQLESAKLAIGQTPVRKVYIDGGFADNDLFVKLLSYHFKEYKLRTTQSPLGSALGAALVISDEKIGKKFLKKHYNLKKHKPLILNK